MPFIPDYAVLEHSTGQDFRLVKRLTYRGQDGHTHTARADLVTDMASVPHSLWSIIAPFGEQSLPAILHDQECKDLRKKEPQRSRLRRQQRRAIDTCFYQSLLERGVPRYRATMMWTGVSISRFWEHGGRVQRVALLLQLMLGWVAIVWGAFHLADPLGWVALVAPAAAALAWGRSSPAIMFAQYPGLGFLLMAIAAFALSTLDWLINIVFGARIPEPPAKRTEAQRSPKKRRHGRRGHPRHRFRGVGGPKGLRILPR